MTVGYLEIVGLGSVLPAPLHFNTSQSMIVADPQECVQACTQLTATACKAFYLASDGVTCHLGSFATTGSGQGEVVTSVQQLFSIHETSLGKDKFLVVC